MAKQKVVKVELTRGDALYLRQHCTGAIRMLKLMIEKWDSGDALSPSVARLTDKLRKVERIRAAVGEGIRAPATRQS